MCAARYVWPLMVTPSHTPMRAHDAIHAAMLSAAPAQPYHGIRSRNGFAACRAIGEASSGIAFSIGAVGCVIVMLRLSLYAAWPDQLRSTDKRQSPHKDSTARPLEAGSAWGAPANGGCLSTFADSAVSLSPSKKNGRDAQSAR